MLDIKGFLSAWFNLDRVVGGHTLPTPVPPEQCGPLPRLPEQQFFEDHFRLRALVEAQTKLSGEIAPAEFARIAELACRVAGYFPRPLAALTLAQEAQAKVQKRSPVQGLDLAIQIYEHLKICAPEFPDARVSLLETINRLAAGNDRDAALRARDFIARHEQDVVLANMGGASIKISRTPE